MKPFYAAVVLLAELGGVVGLPATTVASAPSIYPVKPSPTIKTPCQALCTRGYHSFYDPATENCICVPDNKEEQECVSKTICVEFSVPMVPVWNSESKECNCEPRNRNDDEFICIAATTCLIGSTPYWNPITKKCSCLKIKPDSIPARRDVPALNSPSPTLIIRPTPTPTFDTCTLLKIFCECGDHHQHWSEGKQSCQCPQCGPVVSLGCENLLIYCNEGDHKMHWNPVSKKCECPLPTAVPTPKPTKREISETNTPKVATPTPSSGPKPTSRADKCPMLKMLCPCGDRHLHWNEELQQCACQPCNPPPGVVCENFEIYCSGGDHRMHWDPVSGKCQCLIPMVTDYAPEPLPTM
ncbi:hypothetical protein IFR05_006907 [Cadophora sp. M221]|nr:hypothetical protein IFR05_006907 [Cadophora sp. M221]